MKRILIGYYIGNSVQLDIQHKKLSSFDNKKAYVLRPTMMRLFLYLLENAAGKIVTTDNILHDVWDLHSLKSSSQRLWQVMQALKFRLAALGVPHDFIMRVETTEVKGFTLNAELIRPFYFYLDEDTLLKSGSP